MSNFLAFSKSHESIPAGDLCISAPSTFCVKQKNDFHHGLLGHIFRLVYHILRFIEDSTVDQEEKHSYANILRAHLSNPELVLLFYNCLSDYGYKKHFPLVEKYNMFKNMNRLSLPNKYDVLLYPSLQGVDGDTRNITD